MNPPYVFFLFRSCQALSIVTCCNLTHRRMLNADLTYPRMDLHDPQYQGFFDVPVDNLYGKPLLKRYIQQHIPNYKEAVVISPDAGGAKRATAVADELDMDFALIHKVCRAL